MIRYGFKRLLYEYSIFSIITLLLTAIHFNVIIFFNKNSKAMQMLQNRVQLIGNLGQDPEVKTFQDGNQLATFNLATSETYRNAEGEKVEDTQWHRVVAKGKTAQIVEKYLKKGKKVAIDGKLITRSYESDGAKKYITEVVVNELLMLGSPNGSKTSN